MERGSSGSGGGAEGAMAPPGPVKIGHKKMATEGGRIDFMFLGPPPYPAAGSATARRHLHNCLGILSRVCPTFVYFPS